MKYVSSMLFVFSVHFLVGQVSIGTSVITSVPVGSYRSEASEEGGSPRSGIGINLIELTYTSRKIIGASVLIGGVVHSNSNDGVSTYNNSTSTRREVGLNFRNPFTIGYIMVGLSASKKSKKHVFTTHLRVGSMRTNCPVFENSNGTIDLGERSSNSRIFSIGGEYNYSLSPNWALSGGVDYLGGIANYENYEMGLNVVNLRIGAEYSFVRGKTEDYKN